ncbi:MAG: BofC C-terminal domain-containing protein [Paenibacillaceae bacterium]
MSFANLIKQLRKQLKSGKRRLTLGIILLLLGVIYMEIGSSNIPNSIATIGMPEETKQLQVLEQINKSGEAHRVFAQKIYICGQELAEIGKLNSTQITQYHKEHPQDQIKLTAEGKVYFVEQVEDISTECKHHAFFGLDKNGNLSLFVGSPDQEQIIHTFFQLNVEHLKTSLPQGTLNQLKQGIPISDLAEYNSVLSTFSDYAVEVNGR